MNTATAVIIYAARYAVIKTTAVLLALVVSYMAASALVP